MYIIGFNGPPRSGKDTIALALSQQLAQTSHIESLSMPMRLAGFGMLGRNYSTEEYQRIKDQEIEGFGGLTFREWMIGFSEEFMKLKFGKDIWGKILRARIEIAGHPEVLLIPDIGFIEETQVLIDWVGVENFLLVRLSREGYDWGNDSRRYVNHPDPLVNVLNLQNDYSVDIAKNRVINTILTMNWNI